MKRSAMSLCVLVAAASLCSAQQPQGQMLLNRTLLSQGDFFSAVFMLSSSIPQPFTAFAVVILPDGSMLDAVTLGPNLKPVASNMPGLSAPFQYQLLSLSIPGGAPGGPYEVVAAFFDPSRPITGRSDSFLDVHAGFTVAGGGDWYSRYGPSGTGDVVQMGSFYVASRKDDPGCAGDVWKKWPEAMTWAGGLTWLERDDWRLPTITELQDICANKDSLDSYTTGSCWSSSEYDADYAWWLYFNDCYPHYGGGKDTWACVRAVRRVE